VPERVDLARWLAHAARDGVQLQGLSDHYVSEAIYLSDPDGHGIEVYWDRPREHWQGQVAERMTTLPLDVDGLLGELADPASERFEVLPAGTVIGHVHLKVADIPGTIAFYGDTLGFALMPGSAGRPRSSRRADTTTTSAPTPGRAPAPRRPHPGRPRSATRRSCSQAARSATEPHSASARRGTRWK
jgi:hypothetical protein